ncbi:MAG: nuclear transport factor 2 family protein [Anaerolineaceae bacterium]|nr:nuclear transport factor 2 family protein [Anaerolineaceae bacterium]
MHPNSKVIEQFYSSFSQHQYAGMIACYSPAIQFSDAVFTLTGKRVGAMWRMLCEAGNDLEISYRAIEADDQQGKAHWEARYTFSATGRKVHNIVEASFVFQSGAIIQHRDQFDFWRWARMALGPIGWTLGWTPVVRQQVQTTAQKRLDRFIASHPEYQD